MKILLTEGAGLTSRQVATRLDRLGHEVWVAASDPWCLARFTRHVHHLMPVPAFGLDPLRWLERVLAGAKAAGIDVVFPTQEQVTVLSHQLPRLAETGLLTAVPPFRALCQVQDKLSALGTLARLGIPQPHTDVVIDAAEASRWTSFPAFVKAPVGTGSTGVIKVTTSPELTEAVQSFIEAGCGADGGVLVQEAVDGQFVMAQCIFDAGRLVAFHANQRVQEGANGSASAKSATALPSLEADLARLGAALSWHGALSVDAIWDGSRAWVIDVNPRPVEPGNALAAGVDMVATMLQVATQDARLAPPALPRRPDARTHQLLMAILGVAQHSGGRLAVLREVARALAHRGVYNGSTEELQPLRKDWRAMVLPLAATVITVIRPSWHRWFTDGAVHRYALAPEGWRRLRTAPPLEKVNSTAA